MQDVEQMAPAVYPAPAPDAGTMRIAPNPT